MTRAELAARDAEDPLGRFRAEFVLDDQPIYLNGNSLGALPRATAARLARATVEEWGRELVDGWDHWVDLPLEVGDRLGAAVLGAAAGQVIVSDATTVNLYKALSAALDARRDRTAVVVSPDDFPTDRYVVQGLAAARELDVRWTVDPVAALDENVAVVLLSHTNFRSGAVADMAAVTDAAHGAGALMVWDLSHSVGAVPVALDAHDVDLAVGCTYKHLNAGPGAPSFIYVRRELQSQLRQPVWGWFGQRDQFVMGPEYDPQPDMRRFLTGTPPILALYAVDEGVRVIADAGIDAIRARSIELTSLLIDLYDEWLAPRGFALATPRDVDGRGAHVSLRHPDAEALCAQLHDAGVIVDHRPPDIVRVAPAPLYTRRVDVWDGLGVIRERV